MTYRERREARAARLREWADKRDAKADAGFKRAHELAAMIPLGQPILVGHHSERHHRAHIAKIEAAGFGAVADARKADRMNGKAANIEDALERSIYDDDPDAIERLTEKLAGLEAERERIKTFNAAVRKAKGDTKAIAAALEALPDRERAKFLSAIKYTPFRNAELKGLPSYVLTNLGGNIKRTRDRLEELKKRAAGEKRYRFLTVKWAGKCATCGGAIEKGANAYYEKAERALYCGRGCLA